MESFGGQQKRAKDVMSWIGQKASRFKLDLITPLGVFEAVEFLCLGLLGKRSLWNVLQAAAHEATEEFDLDLLRRRANEQYIVSESLRAKSWPHRCSLTGTLTYDSISLSRRSEIGLLRRGSNGTGNHSRQAKPANSAASPSR